MSADIIVGIDNTSLLLLCALIAVEIYGVMSSNDIILLIRLASIILVYVVRIRNRKRPICEYIPVE